MLLLLAPAIASAPYTCYTTCFCYLLRLNASTTRFCYSLHSVHRSLLLLAPFCSSLRLLASASRFYSSLLLCASAPRPYSRFGSCLSLLASTTRVGYSLDSATRSTPRFRSSRLPLASVPPPLPALASTRLLVCFCSLLLLSLPLRIHAILLASATCFD